MAELIGGAALGAAFGELLKIVLEVGGKAVGFRSLLGKLRFSLERIGPIIKEIERYYNELDRPTGELDSVITLMKEGTELVRECSKFGMVNPRKLSYRRKLDNLVNLFTIIELQVVNTRHQMEALLKVRRIDSAVKKLAQVNKEDVAGTSAGPVINPVIESEIFDSATSQLDDKNYSAEEEEAVEQMCKLIRKISCGSDDPACFDRAYSAVHETGKGKAKVGNNPRRQGKAKVGYNSGGPERILDTRLPKIDEFNHEDKKTTPKLPPICCCLCGAHIEHDDEFYIGRFLYCYQCHKKVSYSCDPGDVSRAISIEVLGNGSYGGTQKTTLKDGRVVREKYLTQVIVEKREFEKQVENLKTMLSDHPNVIRLHACNYDKGLLIYNYIEADSLFKLLHGMPKTKLRPPDLDSRIKILLGAAKGIAHIHSASGMNFVHGNIKSSNILVTPTADFQAFITDYGLNSLASPVNSSGNDGYQAPEVVETGKPTQESDVYSFGVVLAEMLTGKSPTKIPMETLNQVYRFGKWIDIFDIETKDEIKQGQIILMVQLTMQCVAKKPQLRPSMAKVVEEMERIRGIAFEWYRR